MESMKKTYLIGALATAAALGGYFYQQHTHTPEYRRRHDAEIVNSLEILRETPKKMTRDLEILTKELKDVRESTDRSLEETMRIAVEHEKK